MAGPHRLAALIQLRDKAEKDALDRLGATVRQVVAAVDALEEARLRALVDHRRAAEAGFWSLAEGDHRLALQRVERAEGQLREARGREAAAREAHLKAYQEAEVVRRLAQAREQEARAAEEKRELKTLDEIASRRRGGRGPRS
jgi:flagellar biosynthesis chaperone FliJ